MSSITKLGGAVLGLLGLGLVIFLALHGSDLVLLNPKGVVAAQERSLMVTAAALMLLVVVPVLLLTLGIAWRYRAGNTKATYTPNFDHHGVLEAVWWAIPGAIILALAAITWTSSHQLDPFRALDSSAKPLTVQVVALQWKWLFIYPDQGVASLNELEIPERTPVNFVITSDAPMNSFWIPQLGGQIYAMAGMSSQLHLMADSTGTYQGSSANISGKGFAGMHFTTKSVSQQDFDQWVAMAQHSPQHLGTAEYIALAKPSQNNSPIIYSQVESGLYDDIVMKYMSPSPDNALGGAQ